MPEQINDESDPLLLSCSSEFELTINWLASPIHNGLVFKFPSVNESMSWPKELQIEKLRTNISMNIFFMGIKLC
jgi:hypothetical protein